MYDSHAMMDDVEDNSNSDEELDRQELEVALYSQIHFDSGTQTEQWLDSNNYTYLSRSASLRIGVKELPARTRSNLKQPVFDGEFIAFSKSKSDDDEAVGSTEPLDLSSSQHGKNKIVELETTVGMEKSKGGGVKKQSVVSSLASDMGKSSSVVRCHRDGSAESNKNTNNLVKSPLLEYKIDSKKCALDSIPKHITNVNKSPSEGTKQKKLMKQETGNSPPKVKNLKKGEGVDLKEKVLCLPFSLTKTSKKQKITEIEYNSTHKEIVETQPVTLGKRKATHNLAKLESFLELPKSGIGSLVKQPKNRTASISKTAAAVKPRTPQFFLRRPPATVVKYRQDSDTNTDYSDSETSISSSPVKGKQNTSKDAVLHKNSVIVTTKPKDKNTNQKVTAVTDKKSETGVLAEHRRRQFDAVVSSTSESATTGSHAVSMSSEDETEWDMGDANDLQALVALCDGGDSGDGSSSNQEESTSDSEDVVDSSESEEFITENIPGLQFNLDREVAGLIVENPDNWKINEKDRLSSNTTLNRYFFPRSIQCRNCKTDGHLSRDCPKPLKRRCIFCGTAGHTYQACPDAICFNCSAPGHRVNQCKEQKTKWTTMCDRCWMSGHEEKKCPDRWRQYHITVSPNGSHPAAAPTDVRNPLIFCYNCGKKGHLGFECKMPRMNKFTSAAYPYIACYDSSNNQRTEMRGGRAGMFDFSETARFPDNKSKKQHFKEMKKQGYDRDKQHQFKGHKVTKHIQDSDDEYAHLTKKRKKMNHSSSDEHKANFKTGGGRNARNQFIGQGHKTPFVRDQRSDMATFRRQEVSNEGTMDEILNDFGKHQVNNNEWWNHNGKPAKKKRKRHTNIFELDCFHDDWQKNRPEDRELLADKDMSTFQGSPAQRMDAKGYKKQWKKNKSSQKGPGKSKQQDFMPQFQLNHGDFMQGFQFNQQTYENRTSHYREHDVGGFSRDIHYQEFKASFSNKNSNNSKRQKAGFQRQSSDHSPHPVGGFQVRNDRFVAVKRNQNITVSFRK